MPLKLINSNKGNKKLVYDGYTYTKHKTNKTNITWRCSEYITDIKCRCIIHTDSDNRNDYFFIYFSPLFYSLLF